jgi:hypothetical protein
MMKIVEQCYKQSHSWCYQKVVHDNGHTLRVDIRRNAYDEQSHARVERWSGTKWEFVWDKPISACACQTTSYTAENVSPKVFAEDALDLISTAKKILQP